MPINTMEHYSNGRKSRLVFTARLMQIIFGSGSVALSITLLVITANSCITEYNYDFAYDGSGYYSCDTYTWLALPPVALSSMITLLGCVGMFAHKRPNDVHWHLTLTLDWFNFAISLANLAICSALTVYFNAITLTLLAITLLCFLASLTPIIHTHRLKKRGALPARNSCKGSWSMVDVEHTSNAPYSSYTAPTEHQPSFHRQPSQAISKTGTTARWSGGSDTTVYPSFQSMNEVPPYSGPTSPMRSVVYPKN